MIRVEMSRLMTSSVTSWAFLLAFVPAALAFASCPPPRFDSFSEKTLGDWQFGPSLPDQAREVEEVMRSCGGAVQGVREIPMPTSDDEEGQYLNRADDGFVYFDCGSYSAGPVQIVDDDTVEFMSSLSFASTLPKRRLLVSASCRVAFADDFRIKLKPVDESNNRGKLIGLSRVPYRQPEDVNMAELPSVADLQTFANPGYEIYWQKETICKMANPSQPWMLQRAKWESFVNDDLNEEHGDPFSEEKPTRTDLKGWVRSFDGEEDGEEGATTNSNIAIAGEGLTIQIGALCTATKEARAVTRSYNAGGKLNGVILQEGMIIDA